MCAFDQTGYVCDHKRLTKGGLNDTEVGRQGGKGVMGYFGFGSGNTADEGGFSGIGQTDKAHIRNQLQIEFNFECLTRFTRLGKTGGAVGGCFKPGITETASTTIGNNDFFARSRKILDELAGLNIADQGSCGNFNNQIFAGFAGFVFSQTASSILGFQEFLISEIIEGTLARRCHHNDVTAPASISAIRTAARYVPFPSETYTTAPTFAGLDGYHRFINEFHAA